LVLRVLHLAQAWHSGCPRASRITTPRQSSRVQSWSTWITH